VTFKQKFFEWLPENNRLERIWKLAHVEFKKRYYNDRLGLLWALLNPLFQMSIYFLVFKYIFKAEEENFGLFLFCGLIIWMAFQECTIQGMHLLNTKRFLIENIQFNQLDLFFSHTLSVFIGLGFNTFVFIILSLLADLPIGWSILFLPLLFLNLFFIATGTSILLATLKIYLRDIVHVWAIFLLLGFWGSGIFYSGDKLKEAFAPLFYSNPFVGIIQNIRAIIMKGLLPDWYLFSINFASGLLLLGIAIILFRQFSHKFLETI